MPSFPNFSRRSSRPLDAIQLQEGYGASTTPEVLQSQVPPRNDVSSGDLPFTERPISVMPVELERPPSRFSMMRLRHASDSQLSTRYKAQAKLIPDNTPAPPVEAAAPAPVISYTSPKREKADDGNTGFKPWSRQRSFRAKTSTANQPIQANSTPSKPRKSISDIIFKESSPRRSLANEGTRSSRPSMTTEKSRSSLALPAHRFSGSSTSDEPFYAATTTARPNESTTTTFFKIKRKKVNQDSLFPLPAHLLPSRRPEPQSRSHSRAENTSDIILSATSTAPSRPSINPLGHSPLSQSSTQSEQLRPFIQTHSTGDVPILRIPIPHTGLSNTSPEPANPAVVRRKSTSSAPTSPDMGLPFTRHLRKRSGTFDASMIRHSNDSSVPSVPPPTSGRTSVASTHLGRHSIAGLRTFTSRLRHPSETSPRTSSPGGASSPIHDGSRKETLALPDREEGETAGKYLSRIELEVPKRTLTIALSKSSDAFNHDVLRSLMRSFMFYEVPLDLAIRKFLWDVDLPGEAQQIDRVISAFAERYHECNPHIFHDFDQVYLIAYSLIILHSDLFNKNNKRKMQRSEYQRNTGGHGIDDEILGYFYDNIQWTEFIAQEAAEAEVDGRPRVKSRQSRMSMAGINENMRPIRADPYDWILNPHAGLDKLGPSLRGVMNLDDTYSVSAGTEEFDMHRIRDAFACFGTLEIVSARSRPGAYADSSTTQNPQHASPGLVSIRVVKVGMIWRKDAKRKKTQRPWQQWGALLTASQLYFFRNTSWTRSLMVQVETHRHTPNKALIFRPPLDEFKPDFSLPISGVVALVDSSYDKHKNAFLLAGREELHFEEVLLADNEGDLNDWLAKLNYAAAFNWDASPDNNVRKQADANMRTMLMTSRLANVEQKLLPAKEKLEENLRNARHLQILAPFPPKTRNELLTYGARIGLRVRWSRFEIWRLQAERYMLSKGLDLETKPAVGQNLSSPYPISPRTSSRPGALTRWNSKVSAFGNPSKSKSAKTASPAANGGHILSGKWLKDLDVDHYTTNSRPVSMNVQGETPAAPATASPYLLPSLLTETDNFASSFVLPTEQSSERPVSTLLEVPHRNGVGRESSRSSMLSQQLDISHNCPSSAVRTPSPGITNMESNSDLQRSNSTVRAYFDHPANPGDVPGSPSGRRNRRSMPRTLRDSKEVQGLHHHHRLWKGRDANVSAIDDDTSSVTEHEGIRREPGSFTLHGKKASVITLSPEWQNMSVEERLRYRKETLGDDQKPANSLIDEIQPAPAQPSQMTSVPSGSNRTSYHSVFENFSPVGSDIVQLDYFRPASSGSEKAEFDMPSIRDDRPQPQEFRTSAGQKLFDDADTPRPKRTSAGMTHQPSLRTFLEDASTSTTDDDQHEAHAQVGIALGDPDSDEHMGRSL